MNEISRIARSIFIDALLWFVRANIARDIAARQLIKKGASLRPPKPGSRPYFDYLATRFVGADGFTNAKVLQATVLCADSAP
jgi:hypothetical protein